MPHKLKKWFLISFGIIFLIIGLIGIILPVLPTTPFLLLAAVCFLHSSPRLHTALLRQRYIGAYLRNYLEEKGMSLISKIWTLSLLWIALGFTAAFATDILAVRLILITVLIGVTIHILLIKTIRKRKTIPLTKTQVKQSCKNKKLPTRN